MGQYILKSNIDAEIEKLKGKVYDGSSYCTGWQHALRMLELSLNTLEVKKMNEVPANVILNQFGNKYISSWSGLKEYDNFQLNEEIKILIPDK